MNIVLTDHLDKAPSGRFRLEIYRRGILIEVFEENNLIVDGSKQIHAHLLGGDVTNRSVTQIGFGTNPTAPVGGNAALTGAYVKPIDLVTYPATNQVNFAFSLGTTEAQGLAISEFGLITAGNTLYARKVRTNPLWKDVDLTLSGSWLISF